MAYDPQRHHRRSIRLKGHDYAAQGMYYVTICTAGRERCLGRVVDGEVELSAAGRIVAAVWGAIPRRQPHVVLDAVVVMPDHLHGLIGIRERRWDGARQREGGPRGTVRGSLPAIVQSFKAVSARRINRLRGTVGERVWQEDYYEHIVRSAADLDRIRRYIAANPARWGK